MRLPAFKLAHISALRREERNENANYLQWIKFTCTTAISFLFELGKWMHPMNSI